MSSSRLRGRATSKCESEEERRGDEPSPQVFSPRLSSSGSSSPLLFSFPYSGPPSVKGEETQASRASAQRAACWTPFTEGRKLWGKEKRSEERVRERSEGKNLGA